jgi:hypothetical protein
MSVLVAGIHVVLAASAYFLGLQGGRKAWMDGRDKPGHDE